MELVLLTQRNCVPCKLVKNYLDDIGVEYSTINVSDDSTQIEKFNIMSTPTTILLNNDGEVARISGFNPDQLEVFANQL